VFLDVYENNLEELVEMCTRMEEHVFMEIPDDQEE